MLGSGGLLGSLDAVLWRLVGSRGTETDPHSRRFRIFIAVLDFRDGAQLPPTAAGPRFAGNCGRTSLVDHDGDDRGVVTPVAARTKHRNRGERDRPGGSGCRAGVNDSIGGSLGLALGVFRKRSSRFPAWIVVLEIRQRSPQ